MIERAFIDCDGVLADFFTAACEVFGYAPESLAAETNIIKALAPSEKEFWQTIASVPGFYAHLPMYPWVQELLGFLRELQEFRGIRWEIVFGPSRVPDAREQRAAWCRKNIGRGFSAFRMGASKLDLVRAHEMPETLLIDDSPLEVDRFNAAGGIGLLFPNGRNGRHERSPAAWTIQQVKKLMRGPGMPVHGGMGGDGEIEQVSI